MVSQRRFNESCNGPGLCMARGNYLSRYSRQETGLKFGLGRGGQDRGLLRALELH
jgi:hypothetical protein